MVLLNVLAYDVRVLAEQVDVVDDLFPVVRHRLRRRDLAQAFRLGGVVDGGLGSASMTSAEVRAASALTLSSVLSQIASPWVIHCARDNGVPVAIVVGVVLDVAVVEAAVWAAVVVVVLFDEPQPDAVTATTASASAASCVCNIESSREFGCLLVFWDNSTG